MNMQHVPGAVKSFLVHYVTYFNKTIPLIAFISSRFRY